MTEANNLFSTQLTLKAEIVTPESAFYLKNVRMIVMPGSKGELGILPGHVSLLVGLQAGLVTIYDHNMQILDRIFIASGFAEVTEKSATILVEKAGYLADYNLEDTLKQLTELNETLNLCKDESETILTKKNIQFMEALLAALKL